MKKMLLVLLVSATPYWLSSAMAQERVVEDRVAPRASEASAEAVLVVEVEGKADVLHVRSGEAAEADGHIVVMTRVDADGEGEAQVFQLHGADGKDGGIQTVFVTANGEAVEGVADLTLGLLQRMDENAGSRGWLGVSIGQVSDSLADQLELEGRGVVVLNVVKGSPAEQAGFTEHDIIVSVDGEVVSGDVTKTVQLVAAHEPGDEVEIAVLRGGEENTFVVELGSRADMNQFVWKYDVEPQELIDEHFEISGKLLRLGEDGNWVFGDLGELDLPEGIAGFLPSGHSKAVRVYIDGNKKSIHLNVNHDGEAIEIQREDGGDITVTRTDDSGTESAEVYANEDELAEGDPEAFKFYGQVGVGTVRTWGPLTALDLDCDAHVDLDLGFDWVDLHEDVGQFKAELMEHLEHAGEAYGEAVEEAQGRAADVYREFIEQWQEEHADGRSEGIEFLPFGPKGMKGMGRAMMFGVPGHLAKPKHSFSVKDGGTIEVRTRRGDSELVRTFADEADLEARNPELFERYDRLMQPE